MSTNEYPDSPRGKVEGEELTEVSKLKGEEGDPEPNGTSEIPAGIGKEKSNRRAKFITTAVIYYCNVAFGVFATAGAPTVIDYKNAYNTDMAAISVVFTILRVILLIFALAFGFIFNHVNRHALVVFLLLVVGVMMIALPFTPTLVAFGIVSAIGGIAVAGYATAQVVWVIEIWKEEAGPYIQGQHFFFALGCIFPSLIFAPFLENRSPDSKANAVLGNETSLIPSSIGGPPNSTLTNVVSDPSQILSKLYIPSAICGAIVLVGALLQLLIFFCLPDVTKGGNEDSGVGQEDSVGKKNNRRDSSSSANSRGRKEAQGRKWKKIILITLAALFVGVFQAMESNAFQYLPTFTHYSELHMSEAEGAHVMSVYTVAYTVSRLAGIFISFKVIPQFLLCGNIFFVVVANIVLLVAGNGTDTTSHMLAGSALLGIGFSTSIPSVFDYVKMHLEVTNVVGAVLMVAGGVIAALFPLIVGAFIETVPAVIVHLNFASVALGAFTFLCIIFLMRGNDGRKL